MTDQPAKEPQQGNVPPPPELQPGQTPCPHCGLALEWNAQYNQWFCKKCNMFLAPATRPDDIFKEFADGVDDLFGGKPKYYCNVCGARLNWVVQHNRWYCGRCQTWK